MGLVVANGYGRDPNDCCDRGATVHLRFTSEGRPTQYATHSVSLSLYLSIPPSGSISEWFSSRNTLLRRQLKKSERSKQFSLMPSLRPLVRSSALRLRRLPLPSSHRCQPTSRELRASSPCNQASRRRHLLWRWGSRSRDPVWALPSSQLRVGRPPARRGFSGARRRLPLRFGSWLRRRSLSA